MGPRDPRSTVLTPAEEAIIVAFRQRTLLPLEDVMGCLREQIPKLTRSSLHRTNSTEYMTIGVTGNVGIGTTAPATLLHVYAASGYPTISIRNAGTGASAIAGCKYQQAIMPRQIPGRYSHVKTR